MKYRRHASFFVKCDLCIYGIDLSFPWALMLLFGTVTWNVLILSGNVTNNAGTSVTDKAVRHHETSA